MKLITMVPRDKPGEFEQMQPMHPIATACCIILTLAFGLFCLCASTLTSFH
jgi:hypothetical protein